jgi:hypothetical protein
LQKYGSLIILRLKLKLIRLARAFSLTPSTLALKRENYVFNYSIKNAALNLRSGFGCSRDGKFDPLSEKLDSFRSNT